MNILFIHQNFPGQFKHLAPVLAAQGHVVVAMMMHEVKATQWHNVRLVSYMAGRSTTPDVHPWVSDFETKIIRAEACFRAALKLRDSGFQPDVIIAHHGWGESLFLKEVWPKARMGIYCEFFYPTVGGDVGFDPEFANSDPGAICRLHLKNANNLLHFTVADAGISPTVWQASTFPEPFRQRISVIHDGINTAAVRPSTTAHIEVAGRLRLTAADEVITFVNRNLEPYRGYHVFMRSLPELMRRRPKARVIIVGGNEVSYGAKPPKGQSWRDIFLNEVKGELDLSRIHFVGNVPYPVFLALLQISTVHIYLTYPFVLSWSLLEAMSTGCCIVASDTEPLREAIVHGDTGRLVNFFDREGLVHEVCALLDDPQERRRLGANARAFAIEHYDLKSVCLPRQLAWVEDLRVM